MRECCCPLCSCGVNREGVRLAFRREIALYTNLRALEGGRSYGAVRSAKHFETIGKSCDGVGAVFAGIFYYRLL